MKAKTWPELATDMSTKLDIIYSWLYHNNLVLNISTSVFITFGNYRDSVPHDLEIKINGQKLKSVKTSKYLGITYDLSLIHI